MDNNDDNNNNNNKNKASAVTWDANGQPKSTRFDDFYFNTDSGLDESRYVFLEHNNLAERFKALSGHSQSVKALSGHGLSSTHFTLAETGFGTGLNFLAAWQLWQKTASKTATLHFISVEKYPLNFYQMAQALALWPQLKTEADALLAQYPLNVEREQTHTQQENVHRLNFAHGRVKLTLIIDDALAGLKQLLPSANATPCVAEQQAHYSFNPQAVDAWFLDGFSPAKNPDMWQPALYEVIAKLSHSTTTLSTFTAIKSLREGLTNVGFSVKKAKGFGKKREMVTARYIQKQARPTHKETAQKLHCNNGNSHDQTNNPSDNGSDSYNSKLTQPKISRQRAKNSELTGDNWCLAPSLTQGDAQSPASAPKTIAIIGAGLAGCHSANALAKQGLKVTVFDAGEIAGGASGNAQGVVYTRFSHQQDTLAQFNAAALAFADNFYHSHQYFEQFGQRSGVLHLALNEKHQALQKLIAANYAMPANGQNAHDAEGAGNIADRRALQWCSPEQANELAGANLPLGLGGLYTPCGGWLAPRKVCEHLLQQANIDVHSFSRVTQLSKTSSGWQVNYTQQLAEQTLQNPVKKTATFDAVVVACAHQGAAFEQTQFLNFQAIRGQITQAKLRKAKLRTDQEPFNAIKTCICGDGYLAPAIKDPKNNTLQVTFGATFAPKDTSTEVYEADNLRNLELLQALIETPKPTDAAFDSLMGRASFRCATRDYLPCVGPVANSQGMLEAFARYRKNKYSIIDTPGQYHHNLFINVGHGSRGLAYTPLSAELLASVITGQALPISQALYKQLHPARFLIRDLIKNKI